MENKITILFEEMQEKLWTAERDIQSKISSSEQSIIIVRDSLLQLRNLVVQQDFKDTAEEIKFFKEVMPKFYAKLIYYQRVFHVETHFPYTSHAIQKKIVDIELKRINYFFHQNMDFFRYYSSGSIFLDDTLFVRGKYDLRLIHDEYSLMLDPLFCTVHSYKVAKIMAYELLQNYLSQVMDRVEHRQSSLERGIPVNYTIHWTASKTDLIELLYALQTTGVFNNSQADVKKIARFLESIFNLNLGNYYRVFQEIRIRKKNRTSFLDKMKETLLRRMDETDEQGMGR